MVITEKEALSTLEGNMFLGELPEMINSKIVFSGSGNIFICEPGVKLHNSSIEFNANNSIVYLSSSHFPYPVTIVIHSNSICYLGRNNYINDKLTLILSEEKHIFIGHDCCISLGIWMRNADPHLVFNQEDHARINHSKSIYIGDHVWLGQNAMILKGSVIHSGSIVGAMSLVAGKTIPSNSCWGGNPATKLKDEIFWSGECVHSWTEEMTKNNDNCHHDHYTFANTGEVVDISDFERQLQATSQATDKVRLLIKMLLKNNAKNRFYG
jgi:acetyltransferase-like isoleucine patch superfamily enzyme